MGISRSIYYRRRAKTRAKRLLWPFHSVAQRFSPINSRPIWQGAWRTPQ